MKFSVLVANFNNGKFFRDCYQSILSQTYTDWEVIILDDKSTDDSLQIIREITGGDDRFRIFEHPHNEGVGVIKAKLIELATGDICGFVDPDDAILPKAIENAVAVFRNNPKTVLTYSMLMKCDKDLQPVLSSSIISSTSPTRVAIIGFCKISASEITRGQASDSDGIIKKSAFLM